jgi:cellulose synthase/poly-beta-1,6-N-acetylglucosamine synthase-like glycosyltransferase/peptidoglycan/xylan/chitin deacetylase (PgdA/CDA1 family)/spore germination protein YaaH
MNKLPIFHDPSGKRWRWISSLSIVLGIAVTALLASFTVSILTTSPSGLLTLKSARSPLEAINLNSLKTGIFSRHSDKPFAITRKKLPLPSSPPVSIGFYVNWDDSSYASLAKNINQLDWLIPEWLHLTAGNELLKYDIDKKVIALVKSKNPTLKILPLINNFDQEEWQSEALAHWIGSAESRTLLINKLTDFVQENGFDGLTIDFESVPKTSQVDLLMFMSELHKVFAAHGWRLVQSVPFSDSDWNLPRYAQVTDDLILMAYDQHYASGKAGPVAAQEWFDHTLDQPMSKLDPAHTIIAIGNYGYDWKTDQQGHTEGTDVTYQEAMLAARDSEASIHFDETMNPHFAYKEDGYIHNVWFLDAVTAYNQIQASKDYHPAGYALWRMGSEDPSIWQFFTHHNLGNVPNRKLVSTLKNIHFDYDVDFAGAGEILQVAAVPTQGKRMLKTDKEGLIEDEAYTKYPSAYVIQRTGNQDPKAVALTFDDGPDLQWTPQILAVLKQKKVPATFFVVGQNVNRASWLLNRIVQDGHELGNHTYTHPNLGAVPKQVTDLELTANERLVESITGHQMRLWRAPYFGDAEPQTPNEVEPILEAQRKLNYIAVGLRVDPEDWDTDNPNPQQRADAENITQRTIEGVTSTDPEKRGQIVLLHDSGGDRSATVAALPLLIDALQARGYHFVTVGTLAGLEPNEVMPFVPKDDTLANLSDAIVFSVGELGQWALYWIFTAGIILGIARIIFITGVAIVHQRREKPAFSPAYRPYVSIVVPAYREESVVSRTISTLLASDYEGGFEIIMVDDGSPDRTFEMVKQNFKDYPQVRVYQKANGGKASALNYGIEKAKGEIIIALDADTIFPKDAIRLLIRHFENPKVGAVAGNAKVGNRINLVTRWQALEYIISQNLDRRAFALFNCITVVPGAIGAWRKSDVLTAGGFSTDTLAEDQDMTIAIRKMGQIIAYEEHALCYTEAPDTLVTLAKQRFRWAFGTLQCAWKHRDALLSPKQGTLGFIGLPNTWIFQIIFSLISPITDLAFIGSLASIFITKWQHPTEYPPANAIVILLYFAVFLTVDLVTSFIAFRLEKEDTSLIIWLVIQRFVYRQVMYYVMIKSVLSALKGLAPGWGKLERKATVTNV